jgi:hypothetical protein
MTPRRRLPLLIALALVGLLSAGCGSSHSRVSTGTYAGGTTIAPYLDVGPLVYQVQLSRQLNPYDTEDASYLQGLSPLQRTLTSGQGWLAVFVQVYNHHTAPLPDSRILRVSDTQGNVYTPVIPNQTNQFAYRYALVPGHGRLPSPSAIAGYAPTQGALLLYKIDIASFDNRPLKLTIIDPRHPRQFASAEIDV